MTRGYEEVDEKIPTVTFASSLGFNVDAYVKNGALEGLFFMLGEEERKIQQETL